MSTALNNHPITVEQYEGFAGFPGLRDELIYGEIVMSPQPKPLHQQISKNIERLLELALQRQPYVARRDTNIKLAAVHSMPAPDVFVIHRNVWRQACESDEYLSTPPVLAIEVISASNRRTRVQDKVRLYLESGVTAVWELYPKKRTVRVHNPQSSSPDEYHDSEMLTLPEPLQGEVAVTDLFRLYE